MGRPLYSCMRIKNHPIRVVFWRSEEQKLLAHRLDALCAQGFANALTSDHHTDCLQIRVEFTIGRVEGMAARSAEHRFLTALFTLRHDDFLNSKLRTRPVMLPQAGGRGKMESQGWFVSADFPLRSNDSGSIECSRRVRYHQMNHTILWKE